MTIWSNEGWERISRIRKVDQNVARDTRSYGNVVILRPQSALTTLIRRLVINLNQPATADQDAGR